MPIRGTMHDDLFRAQVEDYRQAIDKSTELTHDIVGNFIAKLAATEKDLDEALGEISDLKERVEKLENLTNPESGK